MPLHSWRQLRNVCDVSPGEALHENVKIERKIRVFISYNPLFLWTDKHESFKRKKA